MSYEKCKTCRFEMNAPEMKTPLTAISALIAEGEAPPVFYSSFVIKVCELNGCDPTGDADAE